MKNQLNTISLIFFLILTVVASTSSSAPLKDLPGSIPLQYERQAASDLFYNSKVLIPDQARELFESKKITDLSLINPIETSILWKNKFPKSLTSDYEKLEILPENDELNFISLTTEPVDRIGFIAEKINSTGQSKTYQVFLDLKSHNMLLRKNLLRKIGYNIPAMERLKTVRIKFKGSFSKSEFAKDINRKTFVEAERWVISDPNTEDEYITLQDVIVIEGPDDKMYNLAKGDMVAEIIQGRRLLNSLLIPYAMTDAPESINLMPWHVGQILNTQFVLPYADAEAFTTSYEDARWITRRILKLSVQDWKMIVMQSALPEDVAAVVIEKLIARRNFLREKLNLTEGTEELPVNMNISLGKNLVNGKLEGSWPQYARKFAGIDPDSPLSRQEVLGFFRSKLLSNIISNLLSEFNTRFLPRTDLDYKLFDRALTQSAKDFAYFLTTKEVRKTPVGFWSTKFFNTDLILNREIIAGNYLGTENIVQIADTVGFAVDGGWHFQGEGLPSSVGASGKAKLFFVKTYTHLKPLMSIRAGLKEPFKNIMVPYLKSKTLHPLSFITDLEKQINILDPEELNNQIAAKMQEFTQFFGEGESLITTTSLAPEFSLSVAKSISENARIFISAQDKFLNVQRSHIFRKDKKTIQIYMDPATYNIFNLAFGLTARLPVLHIDWSRQDGGSTTYFFDINIDQDLERNPQFFDNIHIVAAAMKGVTTEYLKTKAKPWEIKHSFTDKNFNFNLLLWKYRNSNTTDRITVTGKTGQQAHFIRRLEGSRSGIDYESLVLDVANALLDDQLPEQNIQIRSNSSGNPGDTIMGKSVTRQVVTEAQITSTNSLRWDNIYAGIVYRWKGWSINKDNLLNVLNDVEKIYQKQIFNKNELHETKEVQFYAVEVQTSLYQKAYEHILSLSDEKVYEIFKYYEKTVLAGEIAADQTHHSNWAVKMITDLKRLRRSIQEGNQVKAVEYLTAVFSNAEAKLEFEGFIAIVGGIQNIFVQGQIRGFRVGAENGNQLIRSETIGQISSFQPFGPLQNLQRNMNISAGEFFITWIINPL